MDKLIDWIVDILEKTGIKRKEREFRYKTTITQDLERIVIMCEPRYPYLGVDIASIGYAEPKKEKGVHFPFIQSHVKTLLKFMEYYQDDVRYHYIFIKYEPSVHTVANTLEDALMIDREELSEDLMRHTEKILKAFGRTLRVKQQEIQKLEEEEKTVVRDSHVERLKFEIDYIDKYIDYRRGGDND